MPTRTILFAGECATRVCHCCAEATRLTRLYTKGHHAIVRCEVCGLQYVDEIPSQAELEAIYGARFFEVGGKFGDAPASAGRANAHELVERLLAL
ncbi:MAG: hypothetical protein HY701_12485, partial [Gemmatimonadetes bacterium]|nr:hypothetical protein [Gemmatimonadota bacterium]